MKRIAFLVALVLFLLTSNLLAQQQYRLAQVANGTFAEGSFKTTFVVFNPNNVAVTVEIILTSSAGQPMTVTIPGMGSASEFAFPLGAGSTRILQTDGSGSVVAGAARVMTELPIGVSAIFSVYSPTGQFQTEAGVGSSESLTNFAFPADTTGNFNTGFALFNFGASDANITVRLLNTEGTQLEQTTVALAAGRHTAQFITQLFPTRVNVRGTLVVSSPTAIAAVPLRQTSNPLSYTSLPAVSLSSTRNNFNLPQVVNGTFAEGSYKTTFLVFNISSSQANVTVTLTSDQGDPFPVTIPGLGTSSTFNVSLAAGASAFLQTDGTGGLSAGAARITSNVPIGAAAIFSVFDPQGRFLTEAGVGPSEELETLTLPVDVTGNFDTAVAFFNPDATPVTAALKLLSDSGEIRGTTTAQLSGRNHRALFVTQLFPGTTNFRGSLAITVPGGITALTLRQNSPNPLTYTTLPVAQGAAQGTQPGVTLLSRRRTGVDATSNQTVNETLASGLRLTGTFSGPGTPDFISAQSGNDLYAGEINPTNGRYLIVVPPGTYNLPVCFSPVSGPTGSADSSHAGGSVTVNGDTTRDITLPAVTLFNVSGIVTGLGALPTNPLLPPAITFNTADNSRGGTFDLAANGSYQGQLPTGTYTASVRLLQFGSGPTDFRIISLYDLGTLTVGSSAVVADFAAPATARLSGNVRVAGLMTLPDLAAVQGSDTSVPVGNPLGCSFPPTGGFTATDPSGAYQLVLRNSRPYNVSATVLVMPGNDVLGVVSFPSAGTATTVNGDSTLDFNIPALPAFRDITGRVTDSSGRGVADVSVIAISQNLTGAANASYATGTETDANGNYRLIVLSGTSYELTFLPPTPLP